jgi:hypothetical protein
LRVAGREAMMVSPGGRMYRFLMFVFVVSGCSADRLTEREAHQTFDAVTEVANEVVTVARDAVERDRNVGLEIESDGSDFSIRGSLDGNGGWSGDLTVTGDGASDGNNFTYDLVLSFADVEDSEGTTLNGDLAVSFFAEDVGDIDLNAAVGTSLDGALDVTGAAEGQAAIEYDLELRFQGLDISFTAEGEISGHDVSGWDDVTIVL